MLGLWLPLWSAAARFKCAWWRGLGGGIARAVWMGKTRIWWPLIIREPCRGRAARPSSGRGGRRRAKPALPVRLVLAAWRGDNGGRPTYPLGVS